MTTVTFHLHGKLQETARRLLAWLGGLLRSLSALKPYHPEAHYMRGRTTPAADDDRRRRPSDRA